jgi:hypothetical protein
MTLWIAARGTVRWMNAVNWSAVSMTCGVSSTRTLLSGTWVSRSRTGGRGSASLLSKPPVRPL